MIAPPRPAPPAGGGTPAGPSGATPQTTGNGSKGTRPRSNGFWFGRTTSWKREKGPGAEVASRYGFAHFKGSHLVGHTRMATESAVTPDRAHPFTAGEDF